LTTFSATTQDASRDLPPQRIAVDLDGVLTEHPRPLAIAVNERFQSDYPERAFVDSAGLNVPVEIREWVYGPDGPASQLQAAPGAQEFLQRLISQFGEGNALIITARPESSAAMTITWLKRNGFPVCNVLFADEKMLVARRQGCGFAVEDSERHARNYAAGGVECFLIDPERGARIGDDEELIHQVEGFEQIVSLLAAMRDREPRRQAVAATLPPLVVRSDEHRPRIVVADVIHPGAREDLGAHADITDVDGTDIPALLAAVADADGLVVRSETEVTAEVFAAAPKLKVVARAGAGIDNIDLAAATRAGVLVLNAPGANAVSAGEHTISLLLAITRQLVPANASTKAGRWERKLMKPVDLKGRTVGIIGLGRVGSIVASRLKAFEMRVIAHDPFIDPERFTQLGVESVDFDRLLSVADIVTFHVPSTDRTRHMLNSETLRELKQGAIVLNVARGDVVDQQALAAAVRAGHVAAAGVDVFPLEPTRESPLFDLPNVIVTPHIGGSSAEALAAVGRVISTSTIAALRGETVANAVNLPPASLEAPTLRRLTRVSGAAGKLIAVLSPEVPDALKLTVRGQVPTDIAEHVLGAALSEALQRWLGRRVTPVNARVVAKEIGVHISSTIEEDDEVAIPQFLFASHGETSHVVCVAWDRANAGITEVDRFSLERPLAGHVLITHHTDQPGVIGTVGTILGRYGVNVAGMQVGRHAPRAEAMMVTSVDDDIPDEALEEIRASNAVKDAVVVALPPFESESDPIVMSAIAAASAITSRK
jgi:D-3-phosphoglycerate dehydrogenase